MGGYTHRVMKAGQKRFLLRGVYVLVIALALLLTVLGLGFIAMYFREGVIAHWGDPDQSLVFWYLPILFIGIASFVGGMALLLVAGRKFKR